MAKQMFENRGETRGGRRIFHYTILDRFKKIVKDKEIRCATAYIGKGERAAVWFSINQEWEETANKMMQGKDGRLRILTKEETAYFGNGLIRIEVSPEIAPYTWEDYKQKSRADTRILAGLYRAAKEQNADPREWRVSFASVKVEKWLSVEMWRGDGWKVIANREDILRITKEE